MPIDETVHSPYISLDIPISLPIAPYSSLYLPISPCTSLYLHASPYISQAVPIDETVQALVTG